MMQYLCFLNIGSRKKPDIVFLRTNTNSFLFLGCFLISKSVGWIFKSWRVHKKMHGKIIHVQRSTAV